MANRAYLGTRPGVPQSRGDWFTYLVYADRGLSANRLNRKQTIEKGPVSPKRLAQVFRGYVFTRAPFLF